MMEAVLRVGRLSHGVLLSSIRKLSKSLRVSNILLVLCFFLFFSVGVFVVGSGFSLLHPRYSYQEP